MGVPEWPAWLDDLVRAVRFSQGNDDWWESAGAALRQPQSDKAIQFLAVLGLVELVTQVHRMERDKTALCAGDELTNGFFRSRGFEIPEAGDGTEESPT
jgi:hypothetical protein